MVKQEITPGDVISFLQNAKNGDIESFTPSDAKSYLERITSLGERGQRVLKFLAMEATRLDCLNPMIVEGTIKTSELARDPMRE